MPRRVRVAGHLVPAPRHLHQLVVHVVLVRDLAPRAVRDLGHPPPPVARDREPLPRAVLDLEKLGAAVRQPQDVAVEVGLRDQPPLGVEREFAYRRLGDPTVV